MHAWHVPNLKLPRCPMPNPTTSALKFQVFDRALGHSKVLCCYHLDARLPCIVSSFSVPLICAQSQILTSACHPGNPISSSCLSRRLCLRLWLSPSAFACSFIVAFVFAFAFVWFHLVSSCFKGLLMIPLVSGFVSLTFAITIAHYSLD